jgi:hypothetical protein
VIPAPPVRVAAPVPQLVLTSGLRNGGQQASEPMLLTLDFKGGSPKALATAISKAMHTHLNVIVSEENNGIEIPPIKVELASLEEFFTALRRASLSSLSTNGNVYETSYGFETTGSGDRAVWYFRVNRPRMAEPPVVCRYYQLEPYLKKLSMDAILSAINEGFEMMGIDRPPQMKFHPETKLLIVVGRSDYLRIVESALDQLKFSGKSDSPKPVPPSAPMLAPARSAR